MSELEQEMRKLIKQRGVVKAKLTTFYSHVKKVMVKESLCETDIINLEERVQRVVDLLSEFDAFQTSLELITPDSESDIQYAARAEFEDIYFSAIADAKKVISDFNASVAITANTRSNSSESSIHQVDGQLSGIRLPVINLPTYDSSLDTWLEYRDTFQSLIHDNTTINDIQKFHYLRASLQGEAAQVIHALELSAANYTVAWDTLCERYNNTSLLIHIHTKALFNLENIQRESSSKLRVLIDSVTKHLRSLAQLEQPVQSWDTLIIYLVTSKLDIATNRAWEQRKSTNSLPTWEELKQFLRDRANMLETLSVKSADKGSNPKKELGTKTKGFHVVAKCGFCHKDHNIYSCAEFAKLSISNRIDEVKKAKLCNNCLQPGHFIKSCRSSSCKRCHRRHNTLLHLETSSDTNTAKTDTNLTDSNQPNVALTASTSNADQVLLSTILITVVDSFNNEHTVRALLDSGSQSSFITNSLVETLHLDKIKTNITICGLNHTISDTQCKCVINIKSQNGHFITDVSCLVIPQITSNLPNIKLDRRTIEIPPNIKLADPSFHIPGRVDILLGADVFWKSLCVGQIHLGPTKPVLQKTRFGWLVSGQVGSLQSKKVQCHFSSNLNLESQLSRFWTLEDCPQYTKSLSIEEEACEKHFVENTRRSENGRFIVSLPLKKPASSLGESLIQAQKRFFSLERKLQNNPVFREQYNNFMDDYERLGHMTLINQCDNITESKIHNHYYMPHHGVTKDSLTTQLRVVFDASASTSNGVSLNDIQMTGPTIQDDLLSIILRFRVHKYVISADIAKMYRQVLIQPEQRSLQYILWRSSPLETLKTYCLNTVTYGHASAPFLAIRCLFELAKECESSLPEISDVIRHSFYVDDLLFSTDSIEKALHVCKNLNLVLSKGHFQLRKWFSNEPKILEGIPNSDLLYNVLKFGTDQNAKTLGLIWNSKVDKLMFHIDTSSKYKAITKRSILSQISTIFDPLGLLAACTIIAKLIIQRLWLAKVSWDESLPSNLHHSWITFKDQLPELNSLQISRQVVCEAPTIIELHGFSDASQSAYGGCVYIKSFNKKGEEFVHLVSAKSKVAPLKVQTLPRLELCGAVILAKLTRKVITALKLNFTRIVLWTDSTIVLGWIKTDSHLLKTFVSNRIAEIQRITASFEWRHVPSKNNPADLLSRGVPPGQIQNESLWWFGPDFLKQPEHEWPTVSSDNTSNLPDMRSQQLTTLLITDNDIFPFEKYSNLSKLKRIIAYIMRFKHNCLSSRSDRSTGQLTQNEIENAFLLLIKLSQLASFPSEVNDLKQGKHVNSKSKCYNLNPFLDKNGLMRVGGRLSNTEFEFDKKHPFILCSKHKLTKIILTDEHQRLLHVGPQSLLASVRERFWPIAGKNLAKATVRNCVTCFRYNTKVTKPIMGDLPSSRLVAETPFHITGVDYAGPFSIRNHKGRGAKYSKSYVCLFVCFATKAVHLELVSDLSSEAFILCLRRFSSRRGMPARIYSDNGLNFVKSNKELQTLGNYLVSQQEALQNCFLNEGIEWRFIPVNSPHFGGLWESGIKSVKHHLKRVVGNASLTFEELYSLLLQIEAILNSRPISPLSTDPNDLTPLTPAHFLIGKTLTSVPDPNVTQIPDNRLSHYQRIQMLRQHFWKRWSKEYVSELQQRQRWKTNESQLKKGDMVIVKDDNLPPVYWKLGRVVELHSGRDNTCRVASVKCANGIIKRGFMKLCPLPIN